MYSMLLAGICTVRISSESHDVTLHKEVLNLVNKDGHDDYQGGAANPGGCFRTCAPANDFPW